jgi:hypothetical protein
VQSFQGLFHVTVNATGTMTATADRFTLTGSDGRDGVGEMLSSAR